MSPEPAVSAERIAKRYRIGEREPYRALRDTLATLPRRVARGLHAGEPRANEYLWALEEVSFEIGSGEAVGIIGRNGAGKSTLLKILSRITRPTRGRAAIRGRVSSLLEVGTGFHPELTGRENVYLNAAILGMRRSEVARRFDEIVAFAEVERFLDTPVKRYSSGMEVRLAFAVAAHLEPEVLIVDEVLAVGDASFQRKCLDKMEDVGHEGRTVLFVSHNMPAVTRLCRRTILLDRGRVLADGRSHEVVTSYLRSGLGTTAGREWDAADAPGDAVARLRAARVVGDDGGVAEAVDIRRAVAIEIEFDVLEHGSVLVPNFHFFNEEGTCVFVVHDSDPDWRRRPRPRGRYSTRAWIPGNLLAEGSLIVGVAVSTLDPVVIHFYERDALAFQIVDALDGDSARGDYAGTIPGVIRPLLEWETSYLAPQP
ncbi:MAG: ABC transporter ATP-binding protein [Gaiellaceae bacterium]